MGVPAGRDGCLWLRMACGQRLLYLPGQSVPLGNGSACADFGPDALSLELSASAAAVRGNSCARTGGQHSLGGGPLQLFIGADCSAANCPGGAVVQMCGLSCMPCLRKHKRLACFFL